MHNSGRWNVIADCGDTIDDSKYSKSENPLTGLYYRLHILNVGVSDLKTYRCQTNVNGMIPNFYLKLDLLGRCNYTLVILTCYCFW